MKSVALLPLLGLAVSIPVSHAAGLDQSGRHLRTKQSRKLTSCTSDTDCASDSEFCSRGTCRPFGSCDTVLDCMNPSNEQFLPQCVGYRTCENGYCGMICSDSTCSPDVGMTEKRDCPSRPCDVAECGEAYESCVDDYCGGCNALFFGAAGELVCTETDPQSDSCNDGYNVCRNEVSMVRKMMCMMEATTRQIFYCARQP